MNIREILPSDIDACVNIMMEAYNPPPWNDHWTEETGKKYLLDYAASGKFVGFVAVEGEEIVGAMFAHRKVWWTNDEIFVDELFVKPEYQRKGIGKMLMEKAEKMSKDLGLGGVTLLTNKYHPAKSFYEKNGYSIAEHVIFMYKVVE